MSHDVYAMIASLLEASDVYLFGVADLEGCSPPSDHRGQLYPLAISFAVPMNPEVMATVRQGPNKAYADEYDRVNSKIDEISEKIEELVKTKGYEARKLPSSDRTDPVALKGDFPHKTAATRAGLGWIGRSAQLITREHGPWIRLGTVFTNIPLAVGKPVTRSRCGKCRVCIEFCPAGALVGNDWQPGIPRENLLDAFTCDRWKKENYYRFNQGQNCGICAAVCPLGK